MDSATRLLDPTQTIAFYGTTPPRLGSSAEEIASAAHKLQARLQALPLDGIVVYDVQDEHDRTDVPRPFPFLPTIETRVYSQLLQELTGVQVVNYKSVDATSEAVWNSWLTDTACEFGIRRLALVGQASSRSRTENAPLPLAQATRLAKAHEAGFAIGGVAIAERHSDVCSESQRMLKKVADGCDFFISQAIYHPEATVRLLNDYRRDCERAGVAPRRIALTFVPCGRPRTMEFIKWLGVAIEPETESAILEAAHPLTKSIEICCDALRRILAEADCDTIPLGLNIESVSINKAEVDASIDLYHALQEVMEERKR